MNISHDVATSEKTGRDFGLLERAMFDVAIPCNPIPFCNGLADYVREHGSDSIKDDTAKRMLWILVTQAYGQLCGPISMTNEYMRLDTLDE